MLKQQILKNFLTSGEFDHNKTEEMFASFLTKHKFKYIKEFSKGNPKNGVSDPKNPKFTLETDFMQSKRFDFLVNNFVIIEIDGG